MAFDGICVAAIVQELKNNLCGGRISKIAQPEADELEVKNGIRIVVDEDAGAVTMTAARDFEDYLFVSMNVSAMVTT